MHVAATKIQSSFRGYRCRKTHRSSYSERHRQRRRRPNCAETVENQKQVHDLAQRIKFLESKEYDTQKLQDELADERKRREALETEHLKLEEAVRFLWKEVVALRSSAFIPKSQPQHQTHQDQQQQKQQQLEEQEDHDDNSNSSSSNSDNDDIDDDFSEDTSTDNDNERPSID